MNKFISLILTVLIVSIYGCGNETGGPEEKKAQIQEYKDQIKSIEAKIESLEQEVSESDPNFAASDRNSTLVTTMPVNNGTFEHYVEIRGEVTSRKNVTISTQVPAMVTNVPAHEGEQVKKGDILATQDAETTRTNIAEVNTSLELAKTRFDRQANLWKQNIGTEFQYLESKNAKESLERKLGTLNAQLNNYIIRAPFSGTIDEVFVKEGEMAQPGVPLLRLVSLSNMYIEADLSEKYLGQFEKGDSVEVIFPNLDKNIQTVISAVGQVINAKNRTYTVEVKIPNDEAMLRPNMLAELKLKDFEQKNAMIVPTNLIQNDNRGDYVFIAQKKENGLVAEKVRVERGMTYNNQTLIKSGLKENSQLINEGARDVAEGTFIKLAEKGKESVAVSSK